MPIWLIAIPILIFSVVVHEVSHGYTAYKRGDKTAYLAGRLTLNPLVHLDPVGSILIPFFGAITGAPVIGWAKPVPVNPYNLREPRKDHFYVALSGPVSNLLLCVVFIVMYTILGIVFGVNQYFATIGVLFRIGVQINLFLAMFNLLPVPPLDGSWVFGHLFPRTIGMLVDKIRPYGTLVLILLLFTGALRLIFIPASYIYSILFSAAHGIIG